MASIFSPSLTTRIVRDDFQPALCLPPPAPHEVMSVVMAGRAATLRCRHPPRQRRHSAEFLYLNSQLTPGITRRPASLTEFESRRVGGRVHAVVRLLPLASSFSP